MKHTHTKGNFRTGGKVSALKVQTESSYVSTAFVKNGIEFGACRSS